MKRTTLKKLPLKKLVRRMEKAPDFGYDDEAMELKRRGYSWTWTKDNKLIINKE